MSDTKISPCPMPGCEGECWDVVAPAHVAGEVRHYAVKCLRCNYCSSEQETKELALAVHAQLCERNRLGKAAEKLMKKPPESAFRDEEDDYYDGFDAAIRVCLDFFTDKESGE